MGYQNLSIFASIISSPVARKVIPATKHNKDLSTPELPEYQKPIASVGSRMKNVLATVAKTSLSCTKPQCNHVPSIQNIGVN